MHAGGLHHHKRELLLLVCILLVDTETKRRTKQHPGQLLAPEPFSGPPLDSSNGGTRTSHCVSKPFSGPSPSRVRIKQTQPCCAQLALQSAPQDKELELFISSAAFPKVPVMFDSHDNIRAVLFWSLNAVFTNPNRTAALCMPMRSVGWESCVCAAVVPPLPASTYNNKPWESHLVAVQARERSVSAGVTFCPACTHTWGKSTCRKCLVALLAAPEPLIFCHHGGIVMRT